MNRMNTPNTPSTSKPLSAAKQPLNFLASPAAGLASESAAMLYASDMLKIFLTDVADRVKTLRRSRHGEPNRLMLQFLTTLSAAPDPVMTLEQLQLPPLADFQSFLRTSLQNIAEDFDADRPLQAYQVLTENLNSTSSYLSDVLSEIETQPLTFGAIQSYLGIAEQGRAAAESSRRNASAPAIGRADSKRTSDAEAEINAETTPAYHKTFFVKSKTGEDFGFTLGDLFGEGGASLVPAMASQPARAAEVHTNGAPKSQKPSDTSQPAAEVKPSDERTPSIAASAAAKSNNEVEPALRTESIKPENIKPAAVKAFPVKEFLQILTAKVDSLISVQGKSSVV
ncbi:MAG: hypothetical protein IAF08_14860, partial [Rhizobacter sp.]|nr:hypothetical protein [Chlorobiales bacterium]